MLTQALDYQVDTSGNCIERAVTQMRYDDRNRHLAKAYDPEIGPAASSGPSALTMH